MCGIAGIVRSDGKPVSVDQIRRMTDMIRHRGPDGEGHYVDGGLALGHRRLAIIDLSPAAAQPMTDPTGRFVLTYNGEIYNFLELRTELEELGHVFQSSGDAAVCLAALIQWGEAALNKFNGMFAFAFYDKAERRLLLARDRYGIKPLYYWRKNGTIAFASEIKAFLGCEEFRAAVDPAALLEYFTFQNFFGEATMFEGVKILPPGSSAVIRVDGDAQVSPKRYWDFSFEEPTQALDDEEYVRECDRLFEQSVRRHLIADVDVGAYLSGGMDSSAIAYVASRQCPGMKTFTVGFDLTSASGLELSFDERAQAEAVSYHCGTEQYEMVLKAGDMERSMNQLVWHLEEPRVGQSYPNLYAAKLASSFNKVVLAGTGSDEIFGGYPWRYYRNSTAKTFQEYVSEYYLYWQRLVPNADLNKMFGPIREALGGLQTLDLFAQVFPEDSRPPQSIGECVNNALYFEAKTFLHGLLVVEDKLSMAHSLECRVPFMDNDLVDFATKLPARLRLKNMGENLRIDENAPGNKPRQFFQKTSDGKVLLRRTMKAYLPDVTVSAVKQGFSAPDSSWFRGESINFVRETLLDPNAKIYDFFDRAKVSELIGDHLSGRVNRRLFVWSLLNFEYWQRNFIGKLAR